MVSSCFSFFGRASEEERKREHLASLCEKMRWIIEVLEQISICDGMIVINGSKNGQKGDNKGGGGGAGVKQGGEGRSWG